MSESIRVDIWSDIACPWCYLGSRRFDAGVRAFAARNPEVEIEIEHHSYELAPDTPENFEGSEIDFLATHKGMPREQVSEMLERMTAMGRAEGVDFDWDALRHANTARAHRVLHLAKSQGLQHEMLERLYRAYFTEGEQVADPDTLARLGEEVGLDSDEVRDAFDDESLAEDVDRDTTRARMLGVTGVPYYLIDHQYAVPGAQSAETFAGALEKVLEFQRTGTSPA